MKVLIACEESQEVCKAFRAKGHEAYSCDIQEPSGGHPEWHILGNALLPLRGGKLRRWMIKGITLMLGTCSLRTRLVHTWLFLARGGSRREESLSACVLKQLRFL